MKNQLQELITKKDFANSIQALQAKLDVGLNRMEELRTKYNDNLPDSCPNGSTNFIYQIKVRDLEPFKVSCATSPPGWTVIQRRIDGSENFNRTWNDYKSGFGNVSGEFFIGLEKLHRMTEERPHELYIKLGMVDGSTSYAQYDDFKIGSEEELYELKNLGKYSGEAGDSLTFNKNQKFSTIDRDNDSASMNCANEFGAWWNKNCSNSKLNAKYYKDGKGDDGIHWASFQKNDWSISLTFVEMMIRPKSL
ncbi:angiopoietin-related protein 1-like [Drosophila rhopaloa]|uniref:Angiopoietin-related protein 1-like n=1 Tax=Drosophila rhopaloa TaxID=1041015 RepID=A0A6P4EQA4_DRORH|nr:angiopoietin-related protein 1-like [Drosophila rhopaloa]